jgi:hypothetical protein
MFGDNSRLMDLHKSLRVAAEEFCVLVEFNERSIDPNDVEKVRHLIESAIHSLDDTAILVGGRGRSVHSYSTPLT